MALYERNEEAGEQRQQEQQERQNSENSCFEELWQQILNEVMRLWS